MKKLVVPVASSPTSTTPLIFSLKGIFGAFETEWVAHIPLAMTLAKIDACTSFTNEVWGPCCKLQTKFSPVPLINAPTAKCIGHNATAGGKNKDPLLTCTVIEVGENKPVSSRLICYQWSSSIL